MRTRAQARLAMGILLIALLVSLVPMARVQAQQPTSDPTPQWPVSSDTHVTCVIEFSPQVNKPGNNVGDGSGHEGIDICAPADTPVYPILPGEIVHVGSWPSWLSAPWGDAVIVKSTYRGRTVFFIYVHLDTTRFSEIHLGEWIQQGQPLGYMSPIKGNSVRWTEPHVHVGLFDANNDPVAIEQHLAQPRPTRDPYLQAEVLSDWMLIWENPRDILGQNPPPASSVSSAPPSPSAAPAATQTPNISSLPTSPQDWANVVWEVYTRVYQYVAGQRVVTVDSGQKPNSSVTSPTPTSTPAPGEDVLVSNTYNMRLNYGSYSTYRENMLTTLWAVSPGKKTKDAYLTVPSSFSGQLDIQPGCWWLNGFFGPYTADAGMGVAEVGDVRLGAGACDISSMVSETLDGAGVKVDFTSTTRHHTQIPGVNPQFSFAVNTVNDVADPTQKNGEDVRFCNTYSTPVTLHWKVDGDLLTLWVTRMIAAPTHVAPTPVPAQGTPVVATPAPQAPILPSNGTFATWASIAMLVLVFLLILWLRPGWIALGTMWVTDSLPMWWRVASESIQWGLRWWLGIMAFAFLVTPELFHIGIYGFAAWMGGESTISHMAMTIVALFFVANGLLNRWFYVKQTRDMGGYWVVEKKQRGCFGQILHGIMATSLVLALFASVGFTMARATTPPPPTPNPLAIQGQGLPPTVQYWLPDINKWSVQYGKGATTDPLVGAVVMTFESCGRPTAESVSGAQGLFQVMPSHWPSDQQTTATMQDPEQNASKAYDWLNQCFAAFPGDLQRSFGCYNGGMGGVSGPMSSWPAETQKYASLAVPAYNELKASNGQSSPTISAWRQPGDSFCNQAVRSLQVPPWNNIPIPNLTP